MQTDIAYSLVTSGGKPGQGYPCVLIEDEMRKPIVYQTEEKVGALLASGYEKLGTQEAASGMYVVEEVSNETHNADTTGTDG